MPKFKLGQTVITRAVNEWIKEKANNDEDEIKRISKLIGEAIGKHHHGDWGIVSEADKQSNDEALIDGDRLLSAYMIQDRKIWIITEWDRSVTTVLFPEDY